MCFDPMLFFIYFHRGENLYELVEIRQMGKLGKASLRCEPCGSGVASLIGFLWVAAFVAKGKIPL
ncbi:hypothetical protein ERO13_A09G216450v2 [Gossypium hirsutum]|nr:hypothetical protein ERO13_A09G216450v2 [Gossypium hirsutum]